MTRVQPQTLQQPGRPDEGAHLQRRLLHDLERQWLAAWAIVHQQQPPPRAAPPPARLGDMPPGQAPADTPANSPPTARLGDGVAQRPLAPPPTHDAAHAPGPGQAATAARAPASPRATGPEEPALAVVRQASLGASPSLPRPRGSQVGPVAQLRAAADPAASVSTARSPTSASPSRADEKPLRTGLGPPRPHGGPGDPAVPVQPQAGGAPPHNPAPGKPAASAGSDARPQATPASPPIAEPPARPGAPARPGLPTAPGTEKGPEPLQHDDEAPPARRFATPSQAHNDTPDTRRLTLRETGPGSVLASLRDAALSEHHSQAAADGLARALMEAGYARVQVVVNGHTPRADGHAGEPHASAHLGAHDTASRPTHAPKERRHGR